MRSRSSALVLVLALVLAAPGCASLILGPDLPDDENTPFAARPVAMVSGTNRRPIATPGTNYGPETRLASWAQEDLARSFEIVTQNTDMASLSGKTVYVGGMRGVPHADTALRAEIRYVAARLAEQVVISRAQLTFDRAEADVIVFPWIQVSGGETTYREMRYQNYPIYHHEEDHRPAWILVFAYDRAERKLAVLEGKRTWQVRIQSYLLGFIPLEEWFVGF